MFNAWSSFFKALRRRPLNKNGRFAYVGSSGSSHGIKRTLIRGEQTFGAGNQYDISNCKPFPEFRRHSHFTRICLAHRLLAVRHICCTCLDSHFDWNMSNCLFSFVSDDHSVWKQLCMDSGQCLARLDWSSVLFPPRLPVTPDLWVTGAEGNALVSSVYPLSVHAPVCLHLTNS